MKKILLGFLVLMFVAYSIPQSQDYTMKVGDKIQFNACSSLELLSVHLSQLPTLPNTKGTATFMLHYNGRPFRFRVNSTYNFAFYPKGDNTEHFFKLFLGDIYKVGSTFYADMGVLNSLACEAGGIEINIDPNTINKKSRGRWITAYIESEGESESTEWMVDAFISYTEEGNGIGGGGAALFTLEIGDTVNVGEMTIELVDAGVLMPGWAAPKTILAAVFEVEYRGTIYPLIIQEGSDDIYPYGSYPPGLDEVTEHLGIKVDDVYTKDYPDNFAYFKLEASGFHNAYFHLAEEDIIQFRTCHGYFYLKPISIDKTTHTTTFELNSPINGIQTFTMSDGEMKYVGGTIMVLWYSSKGFEEKAGQGINVMDINVNTVTLTTPDGSVFKAVNNPKYGFVKDPKPHDEDEDGIEEFMVKFWRMPIQKILPKGLVELIVSGESFDGDSFEGSDTVRVIGKERKGRGRGKKPKKK